MGVAGGRSAEAVGRRQGLVEDFCNLAVEQEKIFPAHPRKTKWLQIAECVPHGKQHFCLGASFAGGEHNRHDDEGALVEEGGGFEQASSDGEFMKLGVDFAPIFELENDGNVAPQAGSWGTFWGAQLGSHGHGVPFGNRAGDIFFPKSGQGSGLSGAQTDFEGGWGARSNYERALSRSYQSHGTFHFSAGPAIPSSSF